MERAKRGLDYSFGANRDRYLSEAKARMGTEKNEVPRVEGAVRAALLACLPEKCRFAITPWAEGLIQRFGESPEALGSPDRALHTWWPDGEHRVMGLEIKAKAQVFNKTIRGGMTKAGVEVPAYGCPSFYLDNEPVYGNMHRFCEKTGMPTNAFALAFAPTDETEPRLMTLAAVDRVVEDGWKKVPVMEDFSQGYGAPCVLIPVEAASVLSSIAAGAFKAASMPVESIEDHAWRPPGPASWHLVLPQGHTIGDTGRRPLPRTMDR